MIRLYIPLAAAWLAACSAPALVRHEFAHAAMGTEFRLVFYASRGAEAERAAEAAFARIVALDEALSDYKMESELARFSRSSDGEVPGPWVELSPEFFRVLAAAQEVARASGGAFDATIGPLVALWRRARRQGELPDEAELARARSALGWRALELDPARCAARLHAARMRLDLGGIAKGYALDEALAELGRRGIERALVVGGGDVRAGAPPPDEPGWRVAIAGLDSADPGSDRAATMLRLAHAALSTSGDLEQALELEGVRYSHILDPRSARALVERRLVSVLAPSATESDAWATALSVLGPEGLTLLSGRPGFAARLVVVTPGGLELFESDPPPAALSCASPARFPSGAGVP